MQTLVCTPNVNMAKLGLVFSGGGGKGAYQIGVWRALEEFGLAEKVRVVAGTSVGALNMVLFAQRDYDLAEHVWLHIRPEDIIGINPGLIEQILREAPIAVPPALLAKVLNFFSSRGLWSKEGLIRMMKEHVNFNTISASNLALYAACTNVTDIPEIMRPVSALTHYLLGQTVPSGTIRYFHLNGCDAERMQRIVLASSALPILFDAEKIDGRVYYDGGLTDNIPVTPVYTEGCDLIIVVQLDVITIIEKEFFPNAELITIIPQDAQGGFLSGTLDFTREGAKRRIEQGYADAVRILQPVSTIREIQRHVSQHLEKAKVEESEFLHKREKVLEERRKLKNALEE